MVRPRSVAVSRVLFETAGPAKPPLPNSSSAWMWRRRSGKSGVMRRRTEVPQPTRTVGHANSKKVRSVAEGLFAWSMVDPLATKSLDSGLDRLRVLCRGVLSSNLAISAAMNNGWLPGRDSSFQGNSKNTLFALCQGGTPNAVELRSREAF